MCQFPATKNLFATQVADEPFAKFKFDDDFVAFDEVVERELLVDVLVVATAEDGCPFVVECSSPQPNDSVAPAHSALSGFRRC